MIKFHPAFDGLWYVAISDEVTVEAPSIRALIMKMKLRISDPFEIIGYYPNGVPVELVSRESAKGESSKRPQPRLNSNALFTKHLPPREKTFTGSEPASAFADPKIIREEEPQPQPPPRDPRGAKQRLDYDLILRLRSQGRTVQEISERCDCALKTVSAIIKKARERGDARATLKRSASFNPNFIWTEQHSIRCAYLVKQGFTAAQIGDQFGCTRNVVIGHAHRKGIPLRQTHGRRQPEKNLSSSSN